jgi:alkylated DNA repair dioxygenase AlkB
MIETIKIRDGGTIRYDQAFIAKPEADALFDRLRVDVPWGEEMNRGRPFPRLTAWYADPGIIYRYSGITHRGVGWTPLVLEIKERVEEAAQAPFNSLLLNRYRTGRDSMGFHADAEPELGINPVIASVSLGAVREFILEHKKTRQQLSYRLAHGSLLIMGGTCQHHWVHALPKTREQVGERINLTFRQIGDVTSSRTSS